MNQLQSIALKLLRGELPSSAGADLAQERIKLCHTCVHYRKMAHQCAICGCFLDLKTRLLESKCPLSRW